MSRAALAVVVLLLGLMGPVMADDKAPAKDSYNVLQVWGLEGEVRFEVVATSKLKEWNKALETSYKEAVKAHSEAKKAGSKAEARPIKPKAKVLKKGLETEEAAEAALAQIKAKWEEAQAKKKKE